MTQGRPVLLFGDVVYVRLAAAPTAEYGGFVVATDGALCLAGMPSAFWTEINSRWAHFTACNEHDAAVTSCQELACAVCGHPDFGA